MERVKRCWLIEDARYDKGAPSFFLRSLTRGTPYHTQQRPGEKKKRATRWTTIPCPTTVGIIKHKTMVFQRYWVVPHKNQRQSRTTVSQNYFRQKVSEWNWLYTLSHELLEVMMHARLGKDGNPIAYLEPRVLGGHDVPHRVRGAKVSAQQAGHHRNHNHARQLRYLQRARGTKQ